MMTDLKAMVDNDLGAYRFTGNVEELFSKYEKRKNRIKRLSVTVSTLCLVIIAFAAGNLFGGDNDSVSVRAVALEIGGNSDITDEPSLLSASKGVRKLTETIYYDSKGRELTDGSVSRKSFNRAYVSPTPLSLELLGDDIKNFTVDCTSNGSLYNGKGEDIREKKLNKKTEINWQPNCEKLINDLGSDALEVPSTLERDRRSTAVLNELLCDADAYNRYFGDTITVTVVHDNDNAETLIVVITLDENGSYYISKLKQV